MNDVDGLIAELQERVKIAEEQQSHYRELADRLIADNDRLLAQHRTQLRLIQALEDGLVIYADVIRQKDRNLQTLAQLEKL